MCSQNGTNTFNGETVVTANGLRGEVNLPLSFFYYHAENSQYSYLKVVDMFPYLLSFDGTMKMNQTSRVHR